MRCARVMNSVDFRACDARAHHVLAHVYEMTERADAGVHWMHERIGYWATDTVVATLSGSVLLYVLQLRISQTCLS